MHAALNKAPFLLLQIEQSDLHVQAAAVSDKLAPAPITQWQGTMTGTGSPK